MSNNPLRAFGANVAEGLKSFGWFVSEEVTRRETTGFYRGGWAPSSNYNYGAEAGELWRNSTVFSCLNWIRRTFPEAPVAVAPIGGGDPDQSHPIARLLRRPNKSYGRSTLLGATAFSYVVDGNAYWFKRRDGTGRVVELWYRPHWMVRPRRNPGSANFIDYYQYAPPGMGQQRIPIEDVVHLRNGIDPDCEMLGMSDLKALLRSVVTDNQAQNFTASMLRNMGVPGAIISPKDGVQAPTREQADQIKADYRDRVSGDNAGMPLIIPAPLDVVFPDVAIDGAALEAIKSLSQADISAAIGIPAVVVGLLVGLKTSTAKASYADARGQAYESCIVPNQSSIAEDMDLQLLPELGNPDTEEVVWDYSNITVLGESTDALHERVREDYKALLYDRYTALQAIGEEATDADKGVYYSGSGGGAPTDPTATGGTRRVAGGQGMTNDPLGDPLVDTAGNGTRNGRNGAGGR